MAKDTPPVKATSLAEATNDCLINRHTFIVSQWKVSGSAETVTHMVCQHCLMPIEYNVQANQWVVNREWIKEKGASAIQNP